MKSSFVVTLVAAVGFAVAQLDQLDKIPKCAYACVSSYISGTSIAGCKPADIACVCSNKQFIADISCCLEKDCSKDDANSTIRFASGLCNANGVQTPNQLVCSSGSASASTESSSSNPTATGSQQTSSAASGSGSATATTAATSTHTGAAAPVFGNPGGLLGAALAIVAAL